MIAKVAISLSQPVNRPAAEAYRVLQAVDRFPEFMPNVRAIRLLAADGHRQLTAWETRLDDAPLDWTAELVYDQENLALQFRALESVFDQAEGRWQVVPENGGSRIVFDIAVSLDLPEIDAVFNPILREKLALYAKSLLAALAQRVGGAA